MLKLQHVASLLAIVLLSGCTVYRTEPPRLHPNQQRLAAKYYHAEVVAEDGTLIRMTVYQPRLKRGETAPLLIHTHGFALTRMKRPLSLYGKVLIAGRVAQQAWDEGYWVISIDQRGHGASGGDVGLIRTDKEATDISRVIDWAVRYLPVTLEDNDPVVGMIGESYGGGVQMLATVVDKRIDALVPMTTWFDLDQALFPNNVPKTEWLMLLGIAGYTMNPTHMDGSILTGTLSEIFGKGDVMLRERLRRNSLSAHCSSNGPKADALLVQGLRDVLFSFNQALQARDCFQRAGRDVRLLAVEHGHMMLGSQWYWGMPVWHMQEEVVCDGRPLKTATVMMDWLNGKLRDDAAALARVPTYCVTGEAGTDSRLANAAPELQWQPLPKVHVGTGFSGTFELVAKPLDRFGNLFLPARVPADWQTPKNGTLRPARVPLLAPSTSTWISGAPKVELSFSEVDRDNAVLFLRLAVWRPGSGSYRVLNDQVTPVRRRGEDTLTVELAAVNAKLEPGEVLGLLVQGYSNQFRLGGSGPGTDASISGRIGLPLADIDRAQVAASRDPVGEAAAK